MIINKPPKVIINNSNGVLTVIDDNNLSDQTTFSSQHIDALIKQPLLVGDMTKNRYDTGGEAPTGDAVDKARTADHAKTADTATNVSIADDSITDEKIGVREATDSTPPASLKVGYLQHLTNIYSMIKLITGKATAIIAPIVSLQWLFDLADGRTPFIPIGWLFVPPFRVFKNEIWNYLWIDCCDVDGAPQNPTSLIITIYVNGTVVYTSSSITTAATALAINLTLTAGDLVRITTSNTTGLTGGISISHKKENRL